MPTSKQQALEQYTDNEIAEYNRAVQAIEKNMKSYTGEKLNVSIYASAKVFKKIKETYEALGWKVSYENDYRESWITLE